MPVTTGPADQSVKEGATPVYFSHPDFTNGEFNVKESVGGLFMPSLGEDASSNGIHGHIRARGGNERQWYQGGRESYFSNPAAQPGKLSPRAHQSSSMQLVRMHDPVVQTRTGRLAS